MKSNSDNEPVNLDGFAEAACGDENERIELVQMYGEQLKEKLPLLAAALEMNQLPGAERVIHTLSGATFSCGLQDFAATLRALELLAKKGEIALAKAKLPEVMSYGARVGASISAELARGRR